ncbi:hypothetical protein I862_07495 [endosymbiont of Acanthamoeba sp. UWC8]|uniref:hypothetical protein n=1 Tax=endosymbiont of Acanthamoeba sp. UWC8 TaxID=86106 RepID=UPI0004D0D22D|nr:hypothetical protein [endosymbiont of Acanthamoeba sp. UWC8]AIF82053.1 hypothetical protein I862_07495 [endosymbiont of Acanthamoeba sp. UWC8]
MLPATILEDRFDLPELPNHISDVNPPIGAKIAAGIVEEGNFGGKGMGTQFYFMKEAKLDWFSQGREIK